MAEIKEKAKSFFLKTNLNSRGLALLIHGFTGSIYDLKEIGDYLVNQGFDVKGVRLAGHGSSPEDLAKTTVGDWWQSVNQEIQTLKDEYQNIFLVGYSFGGNLAIDFAVRYPEIIKAVILLGPSVYIRKDGFCRFFLPIKSIYAKYQKKRIKNKKDFLEYEEKGVYTEMPLKSVKEFFKFIDNYTKKEIPLLDIPILIIQSVRDRVVHPRSARYIYERVSTSQKELFLLDDQEHNPFFYDKKQEIFEKINHFLKNNV